MRLANSLINKRYFLFKSKQMLPYAIIMTLVGVAVTFVMNLIFASNSYNDMTYVISDYHILFPSWIFMYIYPVLMALYLFSFMHKKNASDLFAAAPVTKREYYLTNMFIALIYSAAMILIMMLVSILNINIMNSSGIPQIVAFDAFIKIFLFLLLGFMQVYTITATAATLTGTVPAQLFTAAGMFLVPMALLMIFQFPAFMFVDSTFATGSELGKNYLVLHGPEVSNLIFPINIGTSPFSLFIALLSNNVAEYSGLVTRFTDTPAMLYTLGLIVVYAIVGIEIFSKYKMENVERPFINENFGLVIRAAIFIPIITFLVELCHNDGSIFGEIFITLFVIITVGYIIADLILRKGVKGIGKSLITYVVICVISLVFGVSLGFVINSYDAAEPIKINKNDISQITIYMEPLNVTPYSDENVRKHNVPVTITDKDIISKIIGNTKEESYGGFLWMEVTTNGKTYFAKKNVGGAATLAIYDYIDDNPDIKRSLIVYPGLSKHVKSDILLAYSNTSINSNKTYMTTLNKKSKVKELRKEFEEKLLETPCNTIYKNKIDNAFINNYWITSDGDKFGDNNTKMVMAEIKYANGMYYLSATEIPYATKNFEEIIHSFDDETMYLAVKQDNATFFPIGSINLSEEQILNLENVLMNMPAVLSKEFRELTVNTLDKEIIYDNSVIFSVDHRGRDSYFILNYERDLEPIIEKYADYICGIIATKAESAGYGCYQYGEMVLNHLAPSNKEAGLAELRGNLPKIKELFLTKYTKDTIPMELFKAYVNYWVPEESLFDDSMHLESISFILDDSFETFLDVYVNEREKCEDIVEIRFYHYDFNKELTFQKDDSEIFRILTQAVLFEHLQYSTGADFYTEKYGYINTNPNSIGISISSGSYDYYKEPVSYYYDYEYSFDAFIKYSNGDEENVNLRLNLRACEILKQAIVSQ